MIKEIEKPNIDFKFDIFDDEIFYYDDITDEYINVTCLNSYYYFNLNGQIHRETGPACFRSRSGRTSHLHNHIKYEYKDYYLNNDQHSEPAFAEKTNHLICKSCREFCNQKCF